MGLLVFGLYCEGSSDESFLPSVIQRATEELLKKYDRIDAWDDILIIPTKPQKYGNQTDYYFQGSSVMVCNDRLNLHGKR